MPTGSSAMQLAYEDGVPVWMDLSTSDVAGAADFYTALFGWEVITPGDDEAQPYGDIRRDGGSIAGIQPLPPELAADGVPPFWTVYLKCDDIGATVGRVREHGGGVIVEPTDVGDGSFAVVTDPTGGVVGLWDGPGMAEVFETGTYAWSELATKAPADAGAFFAAVFPRLRRDDATIEGSPYTIFWSGDTGVFGVTAFPPGVPQGVPPYWLAYLTVTDTDAAVATVRANGGQVRAPAFGALPGRIAVVADPQGAGFAVITPNPDFDPTDG